MARSVMTWNPQTGLIKTGYYGFSWTYLFFGWWVPLIRGELVVALLHFLFTMSTLGLWQFVVAFLYNKQYTVRLIEKGYVLHDQPDRVYEAQSRIGISPTSRW
jgi:hypothetical protein